MASGRFVSTSIADDTRLGKLSLTAELLYLKTIPHLDRDGMITGRAGALWGRTCPLRDELIGEMQAVINEWVKVGLVVRMDTEDGPVLFFPGFLKNNNLLHYDRERPSRYPVPPGYERTDTGLIIEGTEPKKRGTKKATIPPSSNGNGAELQDKVMDKVMDFALQEQEQEEEEEEDQVEVKVVEAEGSAATADPDVARLWAKWDANMPGTRTPVIVDSVNGLLRDYSIAEIEEAISIACIRNKRNLGFIQGILAKGAFSERPPQRGGDYSTNNGMAAVTEYLVDRGMRNGQH